MNLAELGDALVHAGLELRLEDGKLRYRGPKGALSAELREGIAAHRGALVAELEAASAQCIARDEASRYEPFPLTDLQQAYWVGEQRFFAAEGAGYFYQEYRLATLDLERLRAAVRELTARHDVLRLVVAPDGSSQRFAAEVADPELPRIDRVDVPAAEVEATMIELRARFAARLPRLEEGRPLCFHVVRFASEYRVCVMMRLFAVDGVSLHIVYRELVALYGGHALAEPRATLGYRDYVIARARQREGVAYRRSLHYWMQRLERLPGPPELPSPLESRAATTAAAGLERRAGSLGAADWAHVQERAKREGVPVNSLLCTLFADTLRRWSASPRFTLNVLVANRAALDPEIESVVGNCSSTTLLEVPECDPSARLVERVRALQAQLYADLEHADVPGIRVIRELQRRRGGDGRPPMPVVFTSGIGLTRDFRGFSLGVEGWQLVHSALRTPQVWLDHQVYEEAGALLYNWDFEPSALASTTVAAMFEHYEHQLWRLAHDEAAWHERDLPSLTAAELEARQHANASAAPRPRGNLVTRLLERMESDAGGEGLAILDGDHALGYSELLTRASMVAGGLRRAGCKAGELIAVVLDKGWRQAVAVIGVHFLGAAYLPIDTGTPAARIRHIVAHAGARALICQGQSGAQVEEQAGVARFAMDVDMDTDALTYGIAAQSSRSDDLAYVIYTSGSSGAPKGVAIEHGAALNTIVDVIARFGIGSSDRVLAISSLAFDLSVFDIFGTFAAGATLVYPPQREHPDPGALADTVRSQRVTVWNSVPALLELTCEHLGDRVSTELASLRLIMLSGDWIPLSLAALVRERLPHARLVSLGGATEAAIWSNYHEVDELAPGWTSIPYGRPLANQRLQVLDRGLRPVPRGVAGDLYISGEGLARGYHRAPELTERSFIEHPHTRERLYRTGDLARYRDGGVLEFLGRSDSQVKIGGFRIELGEIEAHLLRCEGVESCVVLASAVGSRGTARTLVAFVVLAAAATLEPERLRERLASLLPHYMVPTVYRAVDRIPLTSNGKVDRRALEPLAREPAGPSEARATPSTASERRLAALWAELLGLDALDELDVEADFFALGGDSLLAVRLFNRIEKAFGWRLPLDSLFASGSVRRQAERLDERRALAGELCVRLREGSPERDPIFVFHPVGGAIFCYRDLVEALPREVPIYGLRAPGLELGEQPAGELDELRDLYLALVRQHVGAGRASFAGWSMGGVLAYAVAQAFAREGGEVSRVVMIDAWVGSGARPDDERRDRDEFLADLRRTEALRSGAVPEALEVLPEALERPFLVFRSHARALRAYCAFRADPIRPAATSLPVTYIEATRSPALHQWIRPFAHEAWAQLAAHWQRIPVDADHYTVMTAPAVHDYAAQLIDARPSPTQGHQ